MWYKFAIIPEWDTSVESDPEGTYMIRNRGTAIALAIAAVLFLLVVVLDHLSAATPSTPASDTRASCPAPAIKTPIGSSSVCVQPGPRLIVHSFVVDPLVNTFTMDYDLVDIPNQYDDLLSFQQGGGQTYVYSQTMFNGARNTQGRRLSGVFTPGFADEKIVFVVATRDDSLRIRDFAQSSNGNPALREIHRFGDDELILPSYGESTAIRRS